MAELDRRDSEPHSLSTTARGDSFRNSIAAMLRAAGISVQTEVLIGHKRVDVCFEQFSFGKKRRFVLEAKNWSTPLDKTDLETIYGG